MEKTMSEKSNCNGESKSQQRKISEISIPDVDQRALAVPSVLEWMEDDDKASLVSESQSLQSTFQTHLNSQHLFSLTVRNKNCHKKYSPLALKMKGSRESTTIGPQTGSDFTNVIVV
jgi:hypothetical protein